MSDRGHDMDTENDGLRTILGGPAAEPARHHGMRKVIPDVLTGAHYSIWYLDVSPNGQCDPETGMQSLRAMFPDGEANDGNAVLFSTSGVHGTYHTIEEIEAGLQRYGDDPEFEDDPPADWPGNTLTVLVVQPRIVCLRCGTVRVRLADIGYLKQLRDSSARVLAQIGYPMAGSGVASDHDLDEAAMAEQLAREIQRVDERNGSGPWEYYEINGNKEYLDRFREYGEAAARYVAAKLRALAEQGGGDE